MTDKELEAAAKKFAGFPDTTEPGEVTDASSEASFLAGAAWQKARENEVLREAVKLLKLFGEQPLIEDLDDEDRDGDFGGAYECFIKKSRAFLEKYKGVKA